jgi:DNA-binding SARP family transcriptional activator
MAGLCFRLLGPLELWDGDRALAVNAARQRVVLAMLLMAPRRAVSVDRLIDAVWDGDPPPTARSQIQICVSALRRLPGMAGLIGTGPHSYSIDVERQRLDYARFYDGVARSRDAVAEGRLAEALENLEGALRLWRGSALAGVPGRAASALANRLEESRIMAIEDRIQIRLGLGAHRELVEELVTLTSDYPLRERLWGFLMVALYRSGRQADALASYRAARAALVDELGVEPGEDLRHLERAILAHDSSLDLAEELALPAERARPATPAPRQLPAGIPDFVGRHAAVAALTEHLTATAADSPHAGGRTRVPVAVITGQPGCGKSTLAIHAAHLVRDHFPDGQLYADLHGNSTRPVPAMEVMARFLRALGVPPEAVPVDGEERAILLRSHLATKRVLLVLDEVADEQHLRGLLPGDPGPAVLVTSRSRLAGLPGARVEEIGLMPVADGTRLLEAVVGHERLAAEPEPANELVRLCGALPLALRIAAVRLAAHPHWSVATLVDRLAHEPSRLDELSHAGVGVRPVLSLVYDVLSEPAQRLLRAISSLETHDVTVLTAGALLDADPGRTARLLDELTDARLVSVVVPQPGMPARYRCHDLVRVFAAELSEAVDDPAERRAAVTRALSCLLAMAGEAHARLYGGDFTLIRGRAPRWEGAAAHYDRLLRDPLGWFDAERATLGAAVVQAGRLGMDELCWELAVNAVAGYESRGAFDEWRATHVAALAATRESGNRRGEAAILASLGSLAVAQHTPDDVEMLQGALGLFEEVGDRLGQALALRNLAHLDRLQGRPESSVERYQAALERFEEVGDRAAQAHVLSGLARAALDQGTLDTAERLVKESLALAQEIGNRRLQAQALHRLGEVFMRSAQMLAARAMFQEALELTRALGDRIGEAYALGGLGYAALELGEVDSAEACFTRMIEICRVAAERNIHAQAVMGLGRVAATRREYDRAEQYFVRAVNAFTAQDNAPWRARALDALHTVREAAERLPLPGVRAPEHPGS